MICPLCGCQQREADLCVQCQSPLSPETDHEKSDTSLENIAPPPMTTPETSLPKVPKYKAPQPEHPVIQKKSTNIQKKALNILITTTQRIEGKRIRTYLGLIHARQVIESKQISDQRSSLLEKAQIQTHLKEGTMKVLQDLKSEAEQLGANAVVACTLSYQQMGQYDFLLAATGTAVQVETPQ
ncbi:MAG: YbjQ family protein [Nitrospiria bacterium]